MSDLFPSITIRSLQLGRPQTVYEEKSLSMHVCSGEIIKAKYSEVFYWSFYIY